MLIYSKSDEAFILIPLGDENGSWVFPSDPGPFAGIHFKVESQLPIIPQIMATISHRLGIDPIQSGYEVCQDFEEQILTDSGNSYSLFVVQCQADLVPVSGIQSPPEKPLRFGSMPEWLARLPATKTRIAWVKAWQVYQGVLMEQIKAVETTEVIRSGRQP